LNNGTILNLERYRSLRHGVSVSEMARRRPGILVARGVPIGTDRGESLKFRLEKRFYFLNPSPVLIRTGARGRCVDEALPPPPVFGDARTIDVDDTEIIF
jgi:hypothetical protein